MTEAKSELVERIVTGRKRFGATNPDTGEQYFAQPGDTVKVSPRTAKTFNHCLTSPEVAEAQAKAEEAARKAEEVATKADAKEPAKVAVPAPAPTASGQAGKSAGQGAGS